MMQPWHRSVVQSLKSETIRHPSHQVNIKHSLAVVLGQHNINKFKTQAIITTGRSVSYAPVFWHSPSIASVQLQNLYLASGIHSNTTKTNSSSCLTLLLTSRGTLGGTALQLGPQRSSSPLICPSSPSRPLLLI